MDHWPQVMPEGGIGRPAACSFPVLTRRTTRKEAADACIWCMGTGVLCGVRLDRLAGMTTTEIKRSFLRWREIPGGVWALGLVSLFMDLSSETIHALLPLYLVTVFGTSMVTVGIIEGIAEATASITKVFSGALSDRLGRRKVLTALGYGLAAFTKPVFPLAASVGWFVAAGFVDRIGKGIRGAPRDALIADLSPERLRGASFGLRQSLDTV